MRELGQYHGDNMTDEQLNMKPCMARDEVQSFCTFSPGFKINRKISAKGKLQTVAMQKYPRNRSKTEKLCKKRFELISKKYKIPLQPRDLDNFYTKIVALKGSCQQLELA
jgi:hypothetical protein